MGQKPAISKARKLSAHRIDLPKQVAELKKLDNWCAAKKQASKRRLLGKIEHLALELRLRSADQRQRDRPRKAASLSELRYECHAPNLVQGELSARHRRGDTGLAVVHRLDRATANLIRVGRQRYDVLITHTHTEFEKAVS